MQESPHHAEEGPDLYIRTCKCMCNCLYYIRLHTCAHASLPAVNCSHTCLCTIDKTHTNGSELLGINESAYTFGDVQIHFLAPSVAKSNFFLTCSRGDPGLSVVSTCRKEIHHPDHEKQGQNFRIFSAASCLAFLKPNMPNTNGDCLPGMQCTSGRRALEPNGDIRSHKSFLAKLANRRTVPRIQNKC